MSCINQLFCKDNLELLTSDIIENESLDLIYCDVLYGTGKDFGEYVDIQAIETEIRTFYTNRLNLMYNKLKPTGSIYIQVDSRINHWMRSILDELFGYENFINEIIWYKKSFSENKDKGFLKRHDYILLYAKSPDFYFSPQYIFNTEKFNRIELGYHNAGDKYIIYNKKKFKEFVIKQKAAGTFKKKKVLICENEPPTCRSHDVIDDIAIINPNAKENTKYPTQKPLKLMERILLSSSKEGDLVADFFMGSGSFIVKAKELNRNYIGCDINSNAKEICQSRLDELDKH